MKVKVMLYAMRETMKKVKVVILSAMRRTARHSTGVASHSTKVYSEINPDEFGNESFLPPPPPPDVRFGVWTVQARAD